MAQIMMKKIIIIYVMFRGLEDISCLKKSGMDIKRKRGTIRVRQVGLL